MLQVCFKCVCVYIWQKVTTKMKENVLYMAKTYMHAWYSTHFLVICLLSEESDPERNHEREGERERGHLWERNCESNCVGKEVKWAVWITCIQERMNIHKMLSCSWGLFQAHVLGDCLCMYPQKVSLKVSLSLFQNLSQSHPQSLSPNLSPSLCQGLRYNAHVMFLSLQSLLSSHVEFKVSILYTFKVKVSLNVFLSSLRFIPSLPALGKGGASPNDSALRPSAKP